MKIIKFYFRLENETKINYCELKKKYNIKNTKCLLLSKELVLEKNQLAFKNQMKNLSYSLLFSLIPLALTLYLEDDIIFVFVIQCVLIFLGLLLSMMALSYSSSIRYSHLKILMLEDLIIIKNCKNSLKYVQNINQYSVVGMADGKLKLKVGLFHVQTSKAHSNS